MGVVLESGLVIAAAIMLASPATAGPPPTPGMEVDDENGRCTAGFAAQGEDGAYYLLTSGHCDSLDGSEWTDGQASPLGQIAASEDDGENDAAIIRLEPGAGMPNGHVGVSVEGLQVDIADVGPFERSIATDRLIVACPLRSSPGQVAENGITAVLADRELEGGFTAAHGRRPSLRDVNQARTTMRRAQLVLKLPLRRRPRA